MSEMNVDKNGTRLIAFCLFIIGIGLLIYLQHIITVTHYRPEYTTSVIALQLLSLFVLSLGAAAIFIVSFFSHQLRGKLLLTFLSIWFALCISELLLRHGKYFYTYQEHRDGFYRSYRDLRPADKYLTWGPGKEHWITTPEFRYWRPTNKYGLGEYDFDSLSKLPGIKIIGLGDSFTEGDGAPYDSSWVKQLGAMFNLEDPGRKPVVTIDAGICGNDPVYSAVQFKNEFVKYHPDIAVLCVNSTDMDDIKLRGGLERYKPDGTLVLPDHPWWEAFYAPVHIVRLCVHQILGYDFTFISKKEHERNIPLYADKLKEAVKFFVKTCKTENIYPVVAMHPMSYEVTNQSYSNELDSLRVCLLKLKGFVFVNVLDYILKLPPEKSDIHKIYWDTDHHHTSTGYFIMAQAIKEKIDTLPVFQTGKK